MLCIFRFILPGAMIPARTFRHRGLIRVEVTTSIVRSQIGAVTQDVSGPLQDYALVSKTDAAGKQHIIHNRKKK